MNFTVRIFDTRACWDEHAFIVTSSQEPPNSLASNWFEQQNNKTTRDKASSPNPDKSSESVRAIARGKAYAFHSHKPYFVAEIKASNVGMPCCFHIKRSFAKYLPKHQEQIVLRVPEGGRWEVNYYYTERNKGLYGGWSAFSRDNNLIEGDYCVFELVNELEMMVYIFR
ncbi:PREDICTED: B3 domain-containing protein Os01g0723500-like [Nelumbo nucifera]|uniref:B3 domain-containing protein Os01g0723500-like n=1 Tax=Nelumbo nucifera TaxID=4432 RepID=A0A1U8QCN1_NELNU|nr:PREDICTED: B3 domain-containing protein Os01g0723500-like [Nelumbo nucifera]